MAKFGVTIQEAIDAKIASTTKTKSNYQRLLKYIEVSDLNLTDDMSLVNSEKGYSTLLDIVKNHPTQSFTSSGKKRTPSNTGAIAGDIIALINHSKPQTEANYFSNKEKNLRDSGKRDLGFDRAAARTSSNLSLPDQDKLHRAIDVSLNKIDNPDVKSWFVVKLLTGLRNPDITQIELEPLDRNKRVDDVKYLSRNMKTVLIYNKGNPTNYHLGDAVYEILREQATRAEKEGRLSLWPISTDPEKVLLGKQSSALESKYGKIINKAMNTELSKDNLEIFDYNKNELIPFTVSHLRKNVFDVLDETVGSDMANQVLGHNLSKDMGLSHYKVLRGNRKTGVSSAMDSFYRLYLNDVGVSDPKNWMTSLGFDQAAEKTPSTFPNTPFGNLENKIEQHQTQAKVTASQLSQTAEETLSNIEKTADKAEKTLERLKNTQEQTDELLTNKPKAPIEKPKAPSYSSLSDEEYVKKMFSNEGLGTEYWLDRGNELKKAVTSKTAKSIAKKLALTAITGGATILPTVADAAVDLALDSSPTGDMPNLEDSTQAELLELLKSEKTTDTREPVANFASRRLEENLDENKAFEARRTNPETTALKEDMDKVFGEKPLAEVIDKRDKESLDTSTRKIEEGLAKYNNSSLLKEYSGFATRP